MIIVCSHKMYFEACRLKSSALPDVEIVCDHYSPGAYMYIWDELTPPPVDLEFIKRREGLVK